MIHDTYVWSGARSLKKSTNRKEKNRQKTGKQSATYGGSLLN